MDAANRFESRTTYRLLRAEYMVGLVISAWLLIAHWDEVRWPVAVGLFLYIDLIGYIPGAIAHHRARDGRVSRVYYVLYNTMHSWLTAGAVVGLWAWVFGWEWALLAVPIHLCGDRGLLGNFLKPFSVEFEPKPHPAFTKFETAVESAGESTVGSTVGSGDQSTPSPEESDGQDAPAPVGARG
ncbi:hypothetical protein ABZ990_05990 [Streptomyces sp. NPDC046203]|uniref:hypothetical protein n=1 Tax=Streptomyces sp. NPDC046203 TaxID=3154602 RepID=UPI0033F352E7